MSQKNGISRRGFLAGTSLAAVGATAGFSGLFGMIAARAQSAGDDPQTIINVAATAEAFAVTHYHRALAKTTKAQFSAADRAYLQAALETEQAHFDFLVANGAKPVTTSFYFPAGTFDSVKTFGTVTGIAEYVFIGAYVAASYRFAQLGAAALSAVSTQVAVVEGQHLAFVNQMAGLFPNSLALAAPLLLNVSDAVPIVQSLLDGKKGALGAMETTSVAQPSAADVKTAVGKSNLISKVPAPLDGLKAPYTTIIEPFTAVVAAMTPAATMAATASK
ncbi:MAG: ferritin-like domain-containing protein [Aggregatilineales bacterium]